MVAFATDRDTSNCDELAERIWNNRPAVRAEFTDFAQFKALLEHEPQSLAAEIESVGGTVPGPAPSARSESITVNEQTARGIWQGDAGLQAEFTGFESFLSAFKARPSLFLSEIRAVRSAN